MSMRPLRLLAAAVCLSLLSAAAWMPAWAQEEQESRVLRVEGEGAARASLALPAGKTVLVDFERVVGDVVVADPTTVEMVARSRRQIYLLGIAVGGTNVMFLDEGGREILDLEVRVDTDLGVLRRTLERYLPSADLEVEAMRDQVILSGRVDSLEEVDSAYNIVSRYVGSESQVLNLVDVSTDQQVLLQVTIAEMERSTMKDLGLDWQVRYGDGGRWSLGLAQILPSGISGGSGLFTGSYDNVLGQGGVTLSSYMFGEQESGYRGQVDGILKALEAQGLIKTIAEPNLTALSGKTATFLSGGEFPIPVGRDSDGVVSVAFRSYGVALQFTPFVQNEGRISMQISTEVSDITPVGAVVQQDISIPGIKTRRADTTVELPSGGSLVIAGLLSESTEQELAGPPGLKDLPVPLLFRSTGFDSVETELVVVVTPYLVEPGHRDDFALPTDGFVPPDTLQDMLFLGRLNKVYGGGREVDGQLRGPGFVLE